METLTSKAIEKAKKDGVASLIREGIPWTYRRVQKRIRRTQVNVRNPISITQGGDIIKNKEKKELK